MEVRAQFRRLPRIHEAAIATLLTLPEPIELPDPRITIPLMVTVGGRHSKLKLLNLEAVAVAVNTGAHVLLAERAATGILPKVLAAEQVDWSSDL